MGLNDPLTTTEEHSMRRTLTTLTLALLASPVLGACTSTGPTAPAPAPTLTSAPVLGTYQVPGGTLVVRVDGTHTMASTLPEGHVMGACAVDTTDATTGAAHRPFYACAPLQTPEGAPVETVHEDGSATYVVRGTAPGAPVLTFDPEEAGFAPRP